MEKHDMDLLEEYIAFGNQDARNQAQLDELCDVIDEIRALYPPPPRAGLMEQTVERIAENLSTRQKLRRLYRKWFINTGWASAAVAAVVLVTMGVLPQRPSDFISTPPAPTTDQTPSAAEMQQSSATVEQPKAVAPTKPQIISAAPAEKSSPNNNTQGPDTQRGVVDTVPPSSLLPPAPAPAPPASAARTPSVEESERPSVMRPEVFKAKGLAFLNLEAFDSSSVPAKDSVSGEAFNAKREATRTQSSDQTDAVPFKVLTVPGKSPESVAVAENPPMVTLVYNTGQFEITVRQWQQTAAASAGPETVHGQTVRVQHGDITVEVSGDADLAVLEQFAQNLQ